MKKILIIDIETTGFMPKGRIVEVGIVELNLDTGEKKILFDQVCHESGITEEEVAKSWIVEHSDLTVEAVRKSRNLVRLKPTIQLIIDSYPIGATAYNNKFDFGYLKNRGFNFPKELPCPMILSTNICKCPGKRGGYKWPSVQEAWDFFFPNTKYIETHRGADDAFHEASIVKELYDRGVFKLN